VALEEDRVRLRREAEDEKLVMRAETAVEREAMLEAKERELLEQREALEERHNQSSATYKVLAQCRLVQCR
jgi:hypothetical protein